MKTLTFKRLAVISAFLGAGIIGANASATIVTLDPAATNGGAGQLSATNGPFTTDKATTNFGSFLTINSLPGAVGPVTATETGFFDINQFSITPNSTSGLHSNYFIYATFTISTTGIWAGTTFIGSPGATTVTATVHGSPGNQTASGLQYCNPTSGTFGICTPGSSDFILGTASLNTGITASATTTGTSSGLAAESFDAILNFLPAAGTTGLSGFWQSPIPFNVTLNTSATGNAGSPGTTYTTSGGKTFILTSVTAGTNPIGAGSGNIIFQSVVPEPGTLALVGLAILALGVVPLRSRFGGMAS